ncbi:sensor histidine kinase [Brevibacterium sp. UMB1308A]|uniref:ATP-binding protein n=1 Tax=Brevibacterium sp. UMB1308A TaxID=3050608 RepID=UPI0025500D1E|nr:sensor histidine kinase [Brevibacterium sp. UMB1308A]MDK8714395.1 sensor histidine kinase [Brevibacterium sp. UMB1308A]
MRPQTLHAGFARRASGRERWRLGCCRRRDSRVYAGRRRRARDVPFDDVSDRHGLRELDAEVAGYGRVEVRLGREAEQTVVDVIDSCGGLRVEDIPRMTEPGWRGDAARTPDASAGGAGLGLAISARVAEAHGGKLTICPLQQGCRIRLSFPARFSEIGARKPCDQDAHQCWA